MGENSTTCIKALSCDTDCHVTYRSGVDEDDDEDHQYDNDNGANDLPLVVLPDDVLEGLERRREPQEGGGGTARGREGGRGGEERRSVI